MFEVTELISINRLVNNYRQGYFQRSWENMNSVEPEKFCEDGWQKYVASRQSSLKCNVHDVIHQQVLCVNFSIYHMWTSSIKDEFQSCRLNHHWFYECQIRGISWVALPNKSDSTAARRLALWCFEFRAKMTFFWMRRTTLNYYCSTLNNFGN